MIVKLVRPHLSNKEGGRGKPQAFSLLGSCLVKVINLAIISKCRANIFLFKTSFLTGLTGNKFQVFMYLRKAGLKVM